ncbi:putative Zn finger-like uncharacterized protein [Brevundimonas bullata]|uniref:Putative Zn finger-like uncharacterized protein n=1 Tax=Brevundimonas bullata TaxID=13160 RepID=A0A7W7N1W3_9CAUL|nr:DUF3426 domain-containing protein [Brevundimonas bullata]MBB4796728.1 putative Zn finger-like uncharacterized protein [Brevundimonas bullata]MBB6381688.1 putative Zn finger-like uncharacterized protein [Brevundimonas bullata]
MILTCPACATSYFVPDEAIGPNGRRVRCKSCGHDWRATLEDEPLELSAATEDVAVETGFGKRDETPESLAETPAPELPRAFRAKAEQQRKMRRAATQGAVWAGLAVVFLALIGAAYAFRLPIVQAWPQAAAVYKLVGAPVNLAGLEFEAVGAKTTPYDPGKVVVSGALRNIRDNEVVAPPVRIALLDAKGVEVAHRIIRLETAPVLPGKVQGFAVVIPDPDRKASGVGVDFVMTPKGEPRTASAQSRAARPATRRPPPAAEEGLRRDTAVDMTPRDAQPIDKSPAQGVSAGHG